MSLLAGTNDTTAPVQTNIHRIARFVPNARVAMVPGAAHDTFLDTCLPAVADELAHICNDPPGVDRDAVHTQTIEQALGFFRQTLPAKAL